ncbi:MAG: CBS domain-containing protein [Candidatus Rokubacteria bacterium]|nr:CBS domain-containing protein [Candidatus Rokubacteria bacterium]
MTIATILAKKGGHVFTVRPDQTIREALAILAERNVGALVVMASAGPPVGILSERDIVRRLVRDEQAFTMKVSELMSKPVISGVPQDDLASAAVTMTEKRIRHLPILDGERLVGVISIGDIVKAQRDEYQGEVETLETQLIEEGRGKVIKH